MTGGPRRIVLAGRSRRRKTAVLEIVKRSLCAHVAVTAGIREHSLQGGLSA